MEMLDQCQERFGMKQSALIEGVIEWFAHRPLEEQKRIALWGPEDDELG